MLAALLIMVVAATFALVIVVAVSSTLQVGAADASAWRAGEARAEAVSAAVSAARWQPASVSGEEEGGDASQSESWTVEWAPSSPAATSPWPCRRVDVVASHGAARRSERLVMQLRAEGWAMGVTTSGDAEFGAPFTVSGCGVYSGGCVRGREHVGFVAQDTTVAEAPDFAHGEDCPVAAVHAAAGIFAASSEIHDPGSPVVYPEDGDPHAGQSPPPEWTAGPSAEFLASAENKAEGPGSAFADGTLRLDALSAAGSGGLAEGRCLLVPRGEEVRITGVAPVFAGRILIICPGDAVVGSDAGPVELRGGLVVCGRLVVRGDVQIEGFLHAGTLVTTRRVSVTVDHDWRQRPLTGGTRPVVVEAGT
jgi:hypothetical protein